VARPVRPTGQAAAVDSSTALALAANGVAICAIGAGWWQNRDSLGNQRRLADLAHVRGLLDDAAIALHGAAYILDEVRSQVTQHTPAFFKSEKGTEVFVDLGRCGRDLDALLERLRVRLGSEHQAVLCFTRAAGALLDIYRACGLARHEPDPNGSPAAAHAIDKFHAETRERLLNQRERFDEARVAFIAAAHAIAGVQLPTA
jgi:hypothetical protein